MRLHGKIKARENPRMKKILSLALVLVMVVAFSACGAEKSLEMVYTDGHDFGTVDFGMSSYEIQEIFGDIKPNNPSSVSSGGTENIEYNCTFEGIPGKVTFAVHKNELLSISFRTENDSAKCMEYHDRLLAYAEEHYKKDSEEDGDTYFNGVASDGESMTVCTGVSGSSPYAYMDMMYRLVR